MYKYFPDNNYRDLQKGLDRKFGDFSQYFKNDCYFLVKQKKRYSFRFISLVKVCLGIIYIGKKTIIDCHRLDIFNQNIKSSLNKAPFNLNDIFSLLAPLVNKIRISYEEIYDSKNIEPKKLEYLARRIKILFMTSELIFKLTRVNSCISTDFHSIETSIVSKCNIKAVEYCHGFVSSPNYETVFPSMGIELITWTQHEAEELQKHPLCDRVTRSFGWPKKIQKITATDAFTYEYLFILPRLRGLSKESKTLIYKSLDYIKSNPRPFMVRSHPDDIKKFRNYKSLKFSESNNPTEDFEVCRNVIGFTSTLLLEGLIHNKVVIQIIENNRPLIPGCITISSIVDLETNRIDSVDNSYEFSEFRSNELIEFLKA